MGYRYEIKAGSGSGIVRTISDKGPETALADRLHSGKEGGLSEVETMRASLVRQWKAMEMKSKA